MDSGRLEAVPNGAVHLDTVRALHQTVVSLRTALEVSKNELKELKEKYERHSHCLEYADVIEKLTVENHVLRRRIIDSDFEDRDARNIKLEVTYTPTELVQPVSGVLIETATEAQSEKFPEISEPDIDRPLSDINSNFCSTEKLNVIQEDCQSASSKSNATAVSSPEEACNTEADLSHLSQSEKNQPSFKTKLELLSKFDVRIKVRTLKEGTVLSSSTSDSDSTVGDKERKETFQFEKHEQFDKQEDVGNKISLKAVSIENIKMAVPNEADVKSTTDKFDVQVRITSDDTLTVKDGSQRNKLDLNVDDLSYRSMSEGENSVFSEAGTAVDASPAPDVQEGSGNESEEVDDIELIFTTDESKDMSMNLQEDLVSIQETDNWPPNSASTTHSTPVLIKFHTLDPDESVEPQTPDSLRKRVSLPNDKEIKRVAFNNENIELPKSGILKTGENKSDNMLNRKARESVDSLTCEYNRISFDDKSCSFEMGSSMDILSGQHLGHRFSVFAERDISKCGTSEDDLAMSLNVRRNTCPNPFQYRPPPFRGVSRPPGPFKVPPQSRTRPVTREPGYPRRENAAQTDLSALPNRWSSDGYLAHNQMCVSSGATPASSLAPRLVTRRAAPRPLPPPSRRTDEGRRVLLSDIGFTSMVPELSRSADPVWALANKPLSEESFTNSTAKFMSRGSSYRSPCPSVDRSGDWTPQLYVPPIPQYAVEGRPWRRSLPDVRRDDTDGLLAEADIFVRRSIDNLHESNPFVDTISVQAGQPYIPEEPRHLRLGHNVKIITPFGRIAVGRVRYVGLAGGTAASSSVVIGVELCPYNGSGLPRNDGTHGGRRYFLAAPGYTAVFVPFSKVVMAWANVY